MSKKEWERSTEHISIRITKSARAKLEKLAREKGLGLTNYIKSVLNI